VGEPVRNVLSGALPDEQRIRDAALDQHARSRETDLARVQELARDRLRGRVEIGVLPRLVHSRFGLHVVEVLEREPGVAQPFESVHGAVAMALRQQSFVTALRQYLRLLAGEAAVEGVELDAADTPLMQ